MPSNYEELIANIYHTWYEQGLLMTLWMGGLSVVWFVKNIQLGLINSGKIIHDMLAIFLIMTHNFLLLCIWTLWILCVSPQMAMMMIAKSLLVFSSFSAVMPSHWLCTIHQHPFVGLVIIWLRYLHCHQCNGLIVLVNFPILLNAHQTLSITMLFADCERYREKHLPDRHQVYLLLPSKSSMLTWFHVNSICIAELAVGSQILSCLSII